MHNYQDSDRRTREARDDVKLAEMYRHYGFDAGPTPREMAEMACHNPNLGDFDEPTADNQEDSNNG